MDNEYRNQDENKQKKSSIDPRCMYGVLILHAAQHLLMAVNGIFYTCYLSATTNQTEQMYSLHTI